MNRLFRNLTNKQNVTLTASLSTSTLLNYAGMAGGTIFLMPDSEVTALAFYGQAAEPISTDESDSLGPVLIDLIVNPGYYTGIDVGSTGLAIPIPDECFGCGAIAIVATFGAGTTEVCNIGFKG